MTPSSRVMERNVIFIEFKHLPFAHLSQVQMLTDRTPMIHLGDDDLNPSQQISSSKATAMKSR